MDYAQDFEIWRDQILAIRKQDVKHLTVPIDEICSEAETTYVEAQKDKEQLIAAGLDWKYVEGLKSLAGATRHLQAYWMGEYQTRQEAQIKWKEMSPEAYSLKSELLHHLSYGYRNNNDLLIKLSRIREGSGHKDMVQDLLELAVLAERNPEPLALINYDTQLNMKARTSSAAMSELLAQVNGNKNEYSDAKLTRDKAFTLLSAHLNIIKECGQYVFWRNEERRMKYASEYG